MSAFKQKLARITASAGVLACATAAILAVGGAGASSASAACSTTIEATGSSLQKLAQQSGFNPAWEATGCGSGSNAKVTYVPSSSGDCLAKYRYTGTATAIETKYKFCGTDDAPTKAQIEHAKEVAHGASTVIVPVTQTAIAIPVHPPANCTLTQITNEKLEEAFSGKATTWTAIGGSGSGCGASLTRVVRKEGSGTTYQFKNYLSKIRSDAAPCAASPTKWSALEPITNADGTPNTTWPECGTIPVTRAEKGSGVVATVVATSGTIGYAALPDVETNTTPPQTLKVQDFGSGTKAVYAAPKSGAEANCEKAVYTVPSSSTGLDVDWSQSFGGNPTIGGGVYPICTLTFDLAWHSYATANPAFGTTVAAQVRAYLEYDVAHSAGNYYSPLPNNVKTAAQFAAEKIN